MIGCAEARGMIGADLLGALDDEERGALVAHLAHCQECAAKHARLAQLVPLIARAGPLDDQPVLPRQAEERLLAGTTSAPRAGRRDWARRRWVPAVGGALVGAAVTLALVALVALLDGRGGGTQSTPPPTMSLALSPTREAPTAGAMVYVINGNNRTTVALEAHGLPAPRPGQRYVVWVSGEYGSYALGTLQVSKSGWATAILKSGHSTWPGTRISILVTPGGSDVGGTRLLARGTL
jgi:anti-sigma factor RsiW